MMKKRYYVIAALALAVIMTAGIGHAWAYFTTYASAEGGYEIILGDKTNIKEEFSSWTKKIVVSNDPGAAPVYVRVKAFAPYPYKLIYKGDDWDPGDGGYYYYQPSISGGGSTSELQIAIDNIPTTENGLKDGEQFNVIVIYESTLVLYKDGVPYADWNNTTDVTTGTETVGKPETGTTGTEESTGGAENSGTAESTNGFNEGTTPDGEGDSES